ncbi:MAG: hypothetical protein KGL39_23760 [Patescibacteria group bacterium]|nr:hypothetical protein [Patescibacteria group bacterium]
MMDDFPVTPDVTPPTVAVVTGEQIEVSWAISMLARYMVTLERVYLEEARKKLESL